MACAVGVPAPGAATLLPAEDVWLASPGAAGAVVPEPWLPATGSGRYGEFTEGPPRAALSRSATYPAAGIASSRPSA